MYNEVIKNEYLDQLQSISIQKIARSLFQNTLGYEEYFEKDLCNFTETEIVEFFTAMQSVSFESIYTKLSVLRGYTQWCIEKNLSNDNINHYDGITKEKLRGCLNKSLYQRKVITLDELREICDGFINPSDRAICYCIFFGIYGDRGSDMRELTADCVDVQTGHIVLRNGKEFRVPLWAAQAIYDSCGEYTYYNYKSNGDISEIRLREDDPTVFKPRDNSSKDTLDLFNKRITRKMMAFSRSTDCVAMTIKRLKNSGMIYTLKNYMEKNDLTLDVAFKRREFKDILKWYGITTYPRTFGVFKEKYGVFLPD